MRARPLPLLLPLFLVLAACATEAGAGRAGSLVLLDAPEGRCAPLGRMSVRLSVAPLASQDALLAAAVGELRARAADRGATHLVLAQHSSPGMVSYTSSATASGVAFRCDEDR